VTAILLNPSSTSSLMSKIDTVDVVVPFHKADNLLWKAISSASRSKNVSLNIIFMDDRQEIGPNDELVLSKISGKLEKMNITYSFNKTTMHGYANALNESKFLVKSQYVGILNSDDLISKNRFWRQAREIDQGFDLSICRLKKFTKIFSLPPMLGSIKTVFEPELLLLGAYGADASLFTSKHLWQTELMFTPNIEMADWEMALRCYPKFRVSYISRTLYFYRMHRRQVSRGSNIHSPLSSEFYDSWCSLAEKLKFPVLDPEQVSVVATPWSSASRVSQEQKMEILNWLSKFQELLDQKNLRLDLIKRRFVLLRLRGFSAQISINVAIKMFLNLIWLCILFQPPRINLQLKAVFTLLRESISPTKGQDWN
jgi:hypothetical protein